MATWTRTGDKTMATWTKLRSGEWGIKGSAGEVREGATLQVRKRSGEVKTVTVRKVVWSGDGIAIAAVESTRNGYTPAKRDARGYVVDRGHYDGYCGYPCPVTGRKCCPENGPCHDCE